MKKTVKLTFYFLLIQIIFSIFFNYIFATNKNFLDISSPSAVVIDFDTGRVLYEKNGSQKRKMASLTKIMTSILLVENCNLDELIDVPKEVAYIGGSTAGLKPNTQVSAKSLLYGMLLPSGNDCAYTVGIHIGGDIKTFAKMMTKKAIEMGITDTNFANPHGLDNENHYTSAISMAKITRYALNNKYINEAVNTREITVDLGGFSKTLTNTNSLLTTYEYADGVKTGFTNGANRCLVASATKDDCRYIAVILGADTSTIRFNDAKYILDECFNKYKKMDISKYLNFYINIPVIKGNIKYYERSYSNNLKIPLTDEEYDKIYIEQNTVQNIYAPLDIESDIGNIKVLIDDEIIFEKNLFLEENIYKKGILDYIHEGLGNMFLEKTII